MGAVPPMLSAVFSGLSRYLQTSCVPVSTRRVAPVGFPFLNTVATVRFRGPKWLVCAQVQAACPPAAPQRLRGAGGAGAAGARRPEAARRQLLAAVGPPAPTLLLHPGSR